MITAKTTFRRPGARAGARRRPTAAGAAGAAGRAAATALMLVAVAAIPRPGVAGSASAQETERECRCVDASGEMIEDCRCLRTPRLDRLERLDGLTYAFGGRMARARIGVSVVPDQDGDIDRTGARLQQVVDGSPADEAGLREGDIVTRVAGRSVLEPLPDEDDEEALDDDGSLAVQRFVALVGRLEPGEEAEIEYVRDGETRRATVVPERATGWAMVSSGDRPSVFFRGDGPEPGAHVFGLAPGGQVRFGDGDEGFRVWTASLDPCFSSAGSGRVLVVGGDRCVDGVHLMELNPQLADYFGVEGGALVTEVEDDAALGLRAGDVIVAVGDRDVADPSDVRRILASYEDDEPVSLTVVRRGARTEVRGTRR